MMSYLTKITLFGLLVLLASCEKENIEIPSENPALISFTPQWQEITESSTRGTPLTDVSQMTTMGVFAYYTGSNTWAEAEATATSGYMHNLQVTQSNGVWGYSPAKYWPKGNVTLFAYAPHAMADNGITVQATPFTGVPKIQYTVPKNCTEQVDLMVAGRQEDRSSGTVTMPMKHALACVGFKVRGDSATVITKISVKGVSVSGTLNLDNTDGVLPQWSDLATADDTEYASGVKAGFTTSSTMTDAMDADGYLMMIPQALGAEAKLIVTVDGVDKEVSLSGKEWKAGESYIYNIYITEPPIIMGYFGGWNGTEYTKLLQVDWELDSIDPPLKWSNGPVTRTKAENEHYGPTNINILKGFGADLLSYPAAKYCEYKGDGWYLPSQNQLMAIWVAFEGVPSKFSFYPNFYWSDTEYTTSIGMCVSFDNGQTGNSMSAGKTTPNRVRCVRDVTL